MGITMHYVVLLCGYGVSWDRSASPLACQAEICTAMQSLHKPRTNRTVLDCTGSICYVLTQTAALVTHLIPSIVNIALS